MNDRLNAVASAFAAAHLADFLAEKREKGEEIKGLEEVACFFDHFKEALEHFPKLMDEQDLWEDN